MQRAVKWPMLFQWQWRKKQQGRKSDCLILFQTLLWSRVWEDYKHVQLQQDCDYGYNDQGLLVLAKETLKKKKKTTTNITVDYSWDGIVDKTRALYKNFGHPGDGAKNCNRSLFFFSWTWSTGEPKWPYLSTDWVHSRDHQSFHSFSPV